jgi:hypothetical protein
VDRPTTRPMASRRVGILAGVFLAGLLFGVTAQFLRQIEGPLMAVGAAIAPWVTIGFVLAARATRGSRSLGSASVLGAETMAAYLLAWILSYHGLFALRESVELSAGWREAFPWLVLAVPVCLVLGFVAALSHKSGILGDVCLALPITWSVPEVIDSLTQGVVVQRHRCHPHCRSRGVAACHCRQARCKPGESGICLRDVGRCGSCLGTHRPEPNSLVIDHWQTGVWPVSDRW